MDGLGTPERIKGGVVGGFGLEEMVFEVVQHLVKALDRREESVPVGWRQRRSRRVEDQGLVAMGYAAVVFEATLSSWLFRREPERRMLADLSQAVIPLGTGFVLLRLLDLAGRGQLPALFAFDLYSIMTLLEFALVMAAVALLLRESSRQRLGTLFRAAMLFMLAGSLYRFDTYLVAFRPGAHWSYFPSVGEILITLGLVAGEILAFIVLVKRFPILTLEKRDVAYHY